jgi:hypothetical protein
MGWLQEDAPAAPDVSATVDFTLNETIENSAAASDSTVEIESVTAEEGDAEPKAAKKPAAKAGLFGRKPAAAKPAAKPAAAKPAAAKPAEKQPSAAPQTPAAKPDSAPAADSGSHPDDDVDFLPPPPGHKSDLDNILDFLQ